MVAAVDIMSLQRHTAIRGVSGLCASGGWWSACRGDCRGACRGALTRRVCNRRVGDRGGLAGCCGSLAG